MRSFSVLVAAVVVGGWLAASRPSAQQPQQPPPEKPKVQLKVQPGVPEPDAKAGQKDAKPDEAATPAPPKASSLPDFRTGEKNPDDTAVAPYDKLNEYGVLPSSAFQDGGTFLPLRQRASEVFQHLRPEEQVHQGQLFGAQLAPVLLEFRFLNPHVKAGDELHAIARLSAVNKPRNFTGLFFHAEYGRSKPAIYVNFEPSKSDPNLFLGRAVLPKWSMGGHYVIQDCVIGDESGHRKAYMGDFFPVLQDKDGSPIGFWVDDNADADFDPPVLRRVELLTRHAKIGENIHFDLWMTDAGAGPSEAQGYWISPSGDQSLRVDMVQAGSDIGHFKSSFQIPEWYEGGRWKLLSVKISDKATNEAYLFPVSEPLLRDIAVDIEQDPEKVDKEAPRLLALQLSHDEIARDKSVDVSVLVEDDKSGVKDVYVSFYSPYGVDFQRVKLSNEPVELNRRSAGKQANVYHGTLRIRPTQEPGRWIVSRVNLSDNANNYRNYNAVRDDIIKDISVVFLDPRTKPATTEEHKQK